MAELTLFHPKGRINKPTNHTFRNMNNYHAYCLFCETQKCATIAALIERTIGIRCISPQIVQRKWVKGKCEEKKHPWLPGYIFLYSEEPITESLHFPGVIRLLGNDELKDEDLAFANMLYERNGTMGTIQLAEVGQRCKVDDPLWKKMEGKIIKIDKGRKRCCVEFSFDKALRNIWLGYEMVTPVNDKAEES